MTPAAAEAADLAWLRRIEAQLHAALAEGAVPHDVAGFRIYLWRTPDPFYRNVALPRHAPISWATAIRDLRAAFARHQRRARVELFAELWPDLAAALQEAGFAIEAQAPVMASPAAPPEVAAAVLPVLRLEGTTPRPMLQACLESAAATFHEPSAMLAPGELERLQESLAGGSLRSLAALDQGRPVAGASLAGCGPVAELLGVWTAAGHRRRGLARALCSRLLHEFFQGGGELAWLAAGSREGLAAYRQLGFRTCGTQLDFADDPAAATAPA